MSSCEDGDEMENCTFKIAICDDDPFFCSQLESMILDDFNDSDIEVFESGERLCASIENGDIYDLIFLDIEIPGIDGVETGLRIRNDLQNEIMQIVYISSKEDYYKLLFEVRPNNFLLKPVAPKSVANEIEKAKRLSNKFNQTFVYKKSYDTYKIPLKDIVYFESRNKKSELS